MKKVIQNIKRKLATARNTLNNSPRRVILDTRKGSANNSTCRVINNTNDMCEVAQYSTRGRVRPAHRHGRPALILALPRSEMPLRWNIAATIHRPALLMSVFTALGLVALGSLSLSSRAYATDVPFSLSVDGMPALEIVLAGDGISTDPTNLGLNMRPNMDGTPVFNYTDLDVTVATSNATGYYLTFSTANADGSLSAVGLSPMATLSGSSNTYTCTRTTAASCGFTTNRWGYKLAQDDATAYKEAPGTTGTKIDETYTATNGITSNMRVGAKIDSSLTAGDYSTTMSFAATVHPTTYGIYYNAGAAGSSAASVPQTQSGALSNSATTTVQLSSTTPTWTGHSFNKWCLGTVNSTAYQNDTCTGVEYAAGDNIEFNMDGMITANLTAMWDIDSYSIKYGTVTGISKVTLDGTECTTAVSGTGCTKSLVYGKEYNLVATVADGYSFDTTTTGWSATSGTFGNAKAASTTFTVAAGASTITPRANANTYSVTIKTSTGISSVSLSGGNLASACTATSTSGTSCTLTYGQSYTLSATASSGYSFSSWSNSASQGTIGGTTTASTTYTPGTSATTLTANASANSYAITLNGDSGVSNFTVNGNTVAKGGSTNLTYGQTYTITINYASNYEAAATPLTKSSGAGTVSGVSFTVGAGIATLYANSKASGFTVTFKANTASGIYLCTSTTSCTSYANNATAQIAAGTYTVYGNYGSRQGFSSWSVTSGGSLGSTSNPATTFTVSGATTLTLNGQTATTAMQNLGVASCPYDNPLLVYDNRDNQAYWIKRMNDTNKCWMMSNLNLGATTLSTNLTSSNTNLSTTITASTFNGWKKSSSTATFTAAEYIPVSGADSTSGTPYGTLYNYCAASAQTICISNNSSDASYDLCPAGWRLPTGNTSGEFQTLYNNSSYNSNAKMRAPISSGGAAFALAGDFGYSAPTGQGNSGFYWSSTRYSGDHMYYLYLNASAVNPANYNYRYLGFSMRCIINHWMCFTAGSRVMIAMNGATKAIEDIKVGDTVVSYDTKTGTFYITQVTKTMAHENAADQLVDLALEDGNTLSMTPNHPILTKDGFKAVDDDRYPTLTEDDIVKTMNGEFKVKSIKVYDVEPTTVYNLNVKDFDELNDDDTDDTYIVNGMVVHNKAG